jgi:hypothetical protein
VVVGVMMVVVVVTENNYNDYSRITSSDELFEADFRTAYRPERRRLAV